MRAEKQKGEDAMNTLFYIAGAVAVVCTLRVVTHTNAVHALLYFIVSLLAAALIFFLLGAPFAAALEIIIYAGAIMVLFMFVIMLLSFGTPPKPNRSPWLRPAGWWGPAILAAVLLMELVYILTAGGEAPGVNAPVGPHALGRTLFGPYALGIELASILLLAGLVGAYHLARPGRPSGAEGGAP
jgi:NADH-quinone oxidoreductase subunit J